MWSTYSSPTKNTTRNRRNRTKPNPPPIHHPLLLPTPIPSSPHLTLPPYITSLHTYHSTPHIIPLPYTLLYTTAPNSSLHKSHSHSISLISSHQPSLSNTQNPKPNTKNISKIFKKVLAKSTKV